MESSYTLGCICIPDFCNPSSTGRTFFFLHPAPSLKQDQHRGTLRKREIRFTCWFTSSKVPLQSWDLTCRTTDYSSVNQQRYWVWLAVWAAKEHCKLLCTLLGCAEVPPRVWAKKRRERERTVTPPNSPSFRQDRIIQARCEYWHQMCFCHVVELTTKEELARFAKTFSIYLLH